MSSGRDELERLKRLREQQIRSRDPKAKEKQIQARVTARRRKLGRRNTSFRYMMRDMLGDLPYKFWGAIIGALLGTVIAIILALVWEDLAMVAMVGLAATVVLTLVGVVFGHSFDWRAEVRDELKDR